MPDTNLVTLDKAKHEIRSVLIWGSDLIEYLAWSYNEQTHVDTEHVNYFVGLPERDPSYTFILEPGMYFASLLVMSHLS
jgi:hypothetical protein